MLLLPLLTKLVVVARRVKARSSERAQAEAGLQLSGSGIKCVSQVGWCSVVGDGGGCCWLTWRREIEGC